MLNQTHFLVLVIFATVGYLGVDMLLRKRPRPLYYLGIILVAAATAYTSYAVAAGQPDDILLLSALGIGAGSIISSAANVSDQMRGKMPASGDVLDGFKNNVFHNVGNIVGSGIIVVILAAPFTGHALVQKQLCASPIRQLFSMISGGPAKLAASLPLPAVSTARDEQTEQAHPVQTTHRSKEHEAKHIHHK